MEIRGAWVAAAWRHRGRARGHAPRPDPRDCRPDLCARDAQPPPAGAWADVGHGGPHDRLLPHGRMMAEPRWRALFAVQAARLLEDLEETDDGPLWTQDLYGCRLRY